MRIISGSAAGRLLKVPKGFDVRPTPDLVRQAVFNSLGDRVIDTRVLELFAGTGALALECLSRGATHAVCVEKSRLHAKFIEENAANAGFSRDRIETRVQDAFAALHQLLHIEQKFDLIVADPPYGEKNVNKRSTSFAQQLLDSPELPKLLSATGLLILGHTKRDTLTLPSWWAEGKMLKHGDTVMRFLTKATAEPTVPIETV